MVSTFCCTTFNDVGNKSVKGISSASAIFTMFQVKVFFSHIPISLYSDIEFLIFELILLVSVLLLYGQF